jgi:hypothetical protein
MKKFVLFAALVPCSVFAGGKEIDPPITVVEETNITVVEETSDHLAAAMALPSVTPDPGRTRIDFGGAGVLNGPTGAGVTLTHRSIGDHAPTVSFSYGRSHDAEVIRATVGFQF